MTTLALLLAGYSIFSALALAVAHFGGEAYRDQPQSRVMGLLLLLALAVLQASHVAALTGEPGWMDAWPVRVALFAVAPCFFLFARPLLEPAPRHAPRWAVALHVLPMLLAPVLPASPARPLAFVLGACYLGWLARRLALLRAERARFPVEMGLLALALVLALGVAVLALLPRLLPASLFVALHASAIGGALMLVQMSLGLRPQLPARVREAAQELRYAQTTLAKVDCDAALARLQALMSTDKLYADADLGLATMAARLDLSAHQLSELLNVRLGKSLARYLREQRVAAASRMLLDEPAASVLSVGLSVGFGTQSSFYEAFREIEGTTPGQYRKLHARPSDGR